MALSAARVQARAADPTPGQPQPGARGSRREGERSRRPRDTSRARHRQGLAFAAPALAVLLAVTIVPAGFLYYVSLFEYSSGTPFSQRKAVGFANYTSALTGADDAFWPAVIVTLGLAAVTTAVSVTLGLVLAMLLLRARGRVVFTTLLLVPVVVTPVIAGLMWRLIFNNLYGALNAALRPLGLQQNWLGDAGLALTSVTIVEVWMWTPFCALILLAGLMAVPREPLEAARMDGANGWQEFRHICYPLLRPILALVIALRVIDALKIFDSVYALTQGGPGKATETLGLLVFHQGLYQVGHIGKASASAVLLLIIVTIASRFVVRYLARAEEAKG